MDGCSLPFTPAPSQKTVENCNGKFNPETNPCYCCPAVEVCPIEQDEIDKKEHDDAISRIAADVPAPDRTNQCKTCRFEGSRKCMSHGYPESEIPRSCQYKIGKSAFMAQCNMCTEARTATLATLDAVFNGVSCLAGTPEEANADQCMKRECVLAMTHVGCHNGNPLDTRVMFDGCLIAHLRQSTTAGDEHHE